MNEEIEVWKSTHDPNYEVSNLGRVRRDGRIKQPQERNCGYLYVAFYPQWKKHNIHRLVAAAFVPNPEGKPLVNHKDGNKKNNRDSNLEWVTAKENTRHAVRIGTFPTGERAGLAKLNTEDVAEIRKIGRSMRQQDIADMFGVSQITVSRILTRTTWKESAVCGF